uniref:DUF834 domain-containing protein n=1 Tax=Oryza sativa subsp. japonica TaxID=39947 RepID=Q84YN0_ORYSJ|nr:hypothetical protein [Oryza sativa Japonica Group]
MDSPATPTDFSPLHSLAPQNTTDDDERRPATSSDGCTARVGNGGSSPATGDGGKGAAGVPLLRVHPTTATDGNGNGYRGGAARLDGRQWRRRLGQSGGGATGDEGARDLGQTEEDD